MFSSCPGNVILSMVADRTLEFLTKIQEIKSKGKESVSKQVNKKKSEKSVFKVDAFSIVRHHSPFINLLNQPAR